MAIGDDFSANSNGDIRHVSGTTTYTVLAFHRWLQDLADDPQASGDDLIDITTSTPSVRSTDNIITLNSPFNIDDTAARFLYDGSITQNGGDEVYSGLQVLGSVVTNTEIMIVQDDKVLPAWWGTGVNADAANSIIQSHLVKTRTGGADIDGQRITVLARELGDQYREFSATLGLANSVAAISTANDLNNESSDATIDGWDTIVITEGYQLIDINGDTTGEPYYVQFDIGSQTKNDTYERSKWYQQRAHIADSNADTGTNYVIDNATILGQGQEWTPNSQNEKLTEARFRIKIGGGTPTGDLTAELYDSDEASPGIPTGGVLATSEPVLGSLITSTYAEVIFRFNDNVTVTTGNDHFIVIRHPDGTATDFFHVEGDATGTHGGNKAEDTGSWAGQAAEDLWFEVKTSPILFTRPGEMHRGITHEIDYDGQTTNLQEDEMLYWGTVITYDNLQNGTFAVGQYVQFQPQGGGAAKNGGKVLADNGSTQMTVALEDIAGGSGLLADNDIITEVESGTATTADINVTITDQDKNGGEGWVLAMDDAGATGTVWIQLVSGLAPVDDLPLNGRTSGGDGTTNLAPTNRTISPEFIGQSTGSNIIGAYGVAFDPNDVGSSDLFFDLGNNQRQPPNNVTFTVTGLVAGEDRVLVAPRSGSSILKAQFQTDTDLTTTTETLIQTDTAVPTETPTAGTLRVELNSAIEKRIRYESNTGNDYTILAPDTFIDGDVDTSDGAGGNSVNIASHPFVTLDRVRLTSSGTLPAGLALATDYWIIAFDANNIQFASSVANAIAGTEVDITGAAGGGTHTITPWAAVGTDEEMRDFSNDNSSQPKNVYLTYIDTLARTTTESYTAVYTSDRDIFVRVRDGGATPIVTFEGTGAVFGASDASIAAIRTSDA